MNNVILQPAGGGQSRKNYEKTVEQPVSFEQMANYISENELADIKNSVTANSICAWGFTPNRGKSQWRKIQPGDTVLFSGSNQFYSASTVVAKVHNSRLAQRLWDIDDDGNTWEWMYFFFT